MAVQREATTGQMPTKPAPWNDPRIRSLFIQAVTIVVIVGFIAYIAHNTASNLARQGIAGGFDFLNYTAGFGISFSLIPYSEVSTYGNALLTGLLNTFLVAICGIVLATIVGFVVGLARLSSNFLVAKLAYAYVEMLRNIPLLLQLIFWYVVVLSALPTPRESLSFLDAFFLNNRGLTVPRPILEDGIGFLVVGVVIAIAAVVFMTRWAKRRRDATGQPFPTVLASLAVLVLVPIAAFLVSGAPLEFEIPTASRFRLDGGLNLVPEFVALLFGLSLYTGAFIAEIVRAGILSVGKGQVEAASALGLKPGQTSRLVVIPQALRVIVPPLTSQYLNLTKNSSLAVAIGYPDLVSVGGTVLNQTGQAIEVVTIWMIVYVSLSLLTSLFMNWYNRKIALVER
ncbi:amino acid ABC transporter permease [Marinivivus vitaminiproducens]|uniref:amino acid ABC transporter permease n=1 Tax=Marinivivus vitaminiproducens TaxID=3035935 RepID=UPI0027A67AAC|nr:amino acid ABC transporter permease [Geminicoccaceae bacterium SCSIO 64248]